MKKHVSSFSIKDGMSKELIDKFREAQIALNNEIGNNEVEINYREKEYKFLETRFLNNLNSQKDHYVVIYLYRSLYYSKDNTLPAFYQAYLKHKKISPLFYNSPPLRDLVASFENCNDPELLDVFTFGPFPSYFYFFTTKFGNELFLQTISSIKDKEKFYSFSRMAFYSPLFLRFISKVFISTISMVKPPIGTVSLGNTIKQRWRINSHLIPSYIIDLLKIERDDIKPANILYNGFFQEACSTPKSQVSLSQIACLTDFFQIPSESLMLILQMVFFPGDPNNILQDLVDITLKSKTQPIKFITNKDKNNVPSLFTSLVISSIDHYFITSNHKSVNKSKSYSPYATKPPNLIIEDSIHNQKEATMAQGNIKPEVPLRHLLKKADLIPYFEDAPYDLTTEEFVNTYLVQLGPPETLMERKEEANILNMLCGFDNEANLIRTLQKVVLDRKKEIRALSAFASITNSLLTIDKLTIDIRRQIENSLLYFLIYNEFKKEILNENNFKEYINNPKLFVDDYTKIITKGKNEIPKYLITKSYPEICYCILANSINYEKFLLLRPELEDYDNSISTNSNKLINDFIMNNFPVPETENNNRKNKNVILREILRNLRNEFEIWEYIIVGFMEKSPMRKISMLKQAFDMIYNYFEEKCPSNMVLGSEEFTPIFILCFLYSNPYGVLSNYVFLNDYACAPIFGEMFSYVTSPAMASCKGIFQLIYEDIPISSFCKYSTC